MGKRRGWLKDTRFLKEALEHGGITPVLAAADVVRFDIVYELLKRGADYRFKDDSGRDLVDRITTMEGRFSAGTKQERYLEKVIAWLKEREVSVP